MNPLAVADNPWVKILAAVKAKILRADLSFRPFCVATFNRAPEVFASDGSPGGDQPWEPPLTRCPAVRLSVVNTPPFEDQGSGQDLWTFSIGVLVKFDLKTRDQRQAVAGMWELARTLFKDWRTGTLDTIKQAHTGMKLYRVIGDLTPTFMEEDSQGVGKAFFILQFELVEGFLG